MDDWLKGVLSKPTASLQDTTRALGYGKNAGKKAVENGSIPTINLRGKKERVATSWLRQKLGIENQ
jgi:hypothetical protein